MFKPSEYKNYTLEYIIYKSSAFRKQNTFINELSVLVNGKVHWRPFGNGHAICKMTVHWANGVV
jgi:hypothetical protein